jgi:hypothetical protein
MRGLIWAIGLLALLYGGYWFVGARAVERGALAAIDALGEQGKRLDHQGLRVAGFPNRFDVTLTEPQFTDAVSGLGWRAPFAQVFSLSYKPWHLIAALPHDQTLILPGGEVAIGSDRFEGSLVMEPGTALTLDRLAVIIEALRLTAPDATTLTAEKVQLATRQAVARAHAHDLAFEATGLALADAQGRELALTGLPATVDRLSLTTEIALDAPIDRHAGQTRPRIVALDIKEALLVWGDLRAHARGQLTPDINGLAAGELTLRVEGWERLPEALAAAGVITPDAVAGVRAMLASMAAPSGVPDAALELPLSLRNGFVSFGFLPLGPAPRLR